jgi:CheY-like chemotaxis protein
MSIILLADDSPHAQRMGERILREEGFAVVSLTDGETALLRMGDVDPDLVIADAFLPGRDGFDLCRQVKARFKHVRVVLTAGLLESFDEDDARRAGCDAVLRKPFEASVVMETILPLIHDAQLARELFSQVAPPPVKDQPVAEIPAPEVQVDPTAGVDASGGQSNVDGEITVDLPVETAVSTGKSTVESPVASPVAPPAAARPDPARIQAAVTVALDAALPALVREITERVLVALGH